MEWRTELGIKYLVYEVNIYWYMQKYYISFPIIILSAEWFVEWNIPKAFQ
jgi:hypothetical protein